MAIYGLVDQASGKRIRTCRFDRGLTLDRAEWVRDRLHAQSKHLWPSRRYAIHTGAPVLAKPVAKPALSCRGALTNIPELASAARACHCKRLADCTYWPNSSACRIAGSFHSCTGAPPVVSPEALRNLLTANIECETAR
jgi:hypothetical protein